MKCRICGARLATEGDICMDCYKELQEEKKLKKDTNEKYVLKREYVIAYNVGKTWQAMVVAIIVLAIGVMALNFWAILAPIIIYLLYLALVLAIDKYLAKSQRITFYDTKAVYKMKSKIKFLNKEKVVKYSDIKEVNVFRTRIQKQNNLADIVIYTDDVIGLSYFRGMRIKNIADPDAVLTEIGYITKLVRK